MKKTGRIMKSMMALCLTVVMVMGMGMQAKAEEPVKITWENGKIIDLGPGESVKISIPTDSMYCFVDGVMKFAALYFVCSESEGIKWIECKTYNWEQYEVYDWPAVFAYTTPRPIQSASSTGSCSHNYEWNTEREATTSEDGLASYKCTNAER